MKLERSAWSDYQRAAAREWLVTNGLGGYAAGTIAGSLTRSYHGLLIIPFQPPLDRRLLVAKADETVLRGGEEFPLYSNHWSGGVVEHVGLEHLEGFQLVGTTPVWTYQAAGARIHKRIWMEPGAQTTYLRYDSDPGGAEISIRIRLLVNWRNHHQVARGRTRTFQVEQADQGVRFFPAGEGPSPCLLAPGADFQPAGTWHRDFFLARERERGLDHREDHYHLGSFQASLPPDSSLSLVFSTEPDPDLDGTSAYQRRREYEQRLLGKAGAVPGREEFWQLTLASDQFLVSRSLPDQPEGKTILAGYPWFGDWGRDTMISLPGLTLSTGRSTQARRILKTYARFLDQGLLPNRFPDRGEEPEYNTADATLWYVEALRAYVADTGDVGLIEELIPALEEIITWHRRGTRYDIGVDPEDGLLAQGQDGLQLTWMDARVGDWVVTPRNGKSVEINALWYQTLRVMEDFSNRLGKPSAEYQERAERVRSSFQRFWNRKSGCCYDVIDGPEGNDPSLRPNQLLAVSLTHSPLTPEQQRAVVEVCQRELLTPFGLRSLAPGHPDYHGSYRGGVVQRDSAYHQGTVWAWLLGPFVEAHFRVFGDRKRARSFLEPLLGQAYTHGLGTLSEIFEGDPPFSPRGCVAQAWSVAAVLQAAGRISEGPENDPGTHRNHTEEVE